jgi:hypothetical protein
LYTDQDGDPVELDRIMRAHAHVEQHISRLKDSGLLSFPFTKIEANRNWMATVMMSADLVRWLQLLCLDGFWAKARPKALRWGLRRRYLQRVEIPLHIPRWTDQWAERRLTNSRD